MTEMGEKAFAPRPEKKAKEKSKKEVNVRLLLFFDGTLNNRTNIDARVEHEDSLEKNTDEPVKYEGVYERYKKVRSYNNAHTNIALLERYVDSDAKLDGYDHTVSIYTEGAGTEDLGRDHTIGYAIGAHKTGIDAKVRRGIEKAIDKLRKLVIGDDELIARMSVDLFGFSRGAASARYCIYQISAEGDFPMVEGLEVEDIELNQMEINFVGLYDTVSSHGLNFNNDVKRLKLDSVAQARKVIQLAAAEEYRAKFSLTDIRSCNDSGGREIFLPGAHSDVGGGYPDDKEEQIVFIGAPAAIRRDKQWLVDHGWYKLEELEDIEWGVEAANLDVGLRGKRKEVRNAYSKIPLKIMIQFCTEEGIQLIEEVPEKVSIAGESASLVALEATLMKYVNSGKPSSASDWQIKDPDLKKVRNQYLHMSAHYSIGMLPRFKNGVRKRKLLNG